MIRVAIYRRHERGHHLELAVIRADVDVKVLHVVRAAAPPVPAVVGHVVAVGDRRRLAVLRASRAVEVEAVEPYTRAVEHLARVRLVDGLRCVGPVQVQVGRHSGRARG